MTRATLPRKASFGSALCGHRHAVTVAFERLVTPPRLVSAPVPSSPMGAQSGGIAAFDLTLDGEGIRDRSGGRPAFRTLRPSALTARYSAARGAPDL